MPHSPWREIRRSMWWCWWQWRGQGIGAGLGVCGGGLMVVAEVCFVVSMIKVGMGGSGDGRDVIEMRVWE